MDEIKCIFCNKSSDLIVIEENGYYGRKCTGCGLIYVSPRPSNDEIQDLYKKDNSHIPAEAQISAGFATRLYAKHNLKIVDKHAKNGSMLEIGAGAGYFLDEARKLDFDVHGIELNTIQVHHIREKLGIPCEETPLSISSFHGKKFHIIYHCDVISHFADPITEFKKMNNALDNTGILVFETGNLGETKEKYLKLYKDFQYPDHLFFFGESSLNQLLHLSGFQLLKRYRYSLVMQLWIFNRFSWLIEIFKKKKPPDDTDYRTVSNVGYKNKSYRGKDIIRNAYHCFMYFMRYKIGAVLPKNGRPQTIIIVAMKIAEVPQEFHKACV